MLTLDSVSLKLSNMERYILQSISFSINRGDCIILLGGNGSGKSSLIKLIQGIYAHSEGKLIFNQKVLNHLSPEKLAMDIISLNQDLSTSLFYELNVLENCLVWELRQKKFCLQLGQHKERTFYHVYLAKFHPNLANKLETPVQLLSGGEKQALLLALCLRFPPQLLLLDEHTSALDPVQATLMMHLTHQALQTHKVTSIMTTHNLEHALQYGNRLIAIKEGKIVFEADENRKKNLTRAELLEWCY